MPRFPYVSSPAPAPPVEFEKIMWPILPYSVQLVHYVKQGYRIVNWDLGKKEYYLERGKERRVVRMSRREYERMGYAWNSYFYGKSGGAGVYSDEFSDAIRMFTRGRVGEEYLASVLSSVRQ